MNARQIRESFEDLKEEKIEDNRFFKWINQIDLALYREMINLKAEDFAQEAIYEISGGNPNQDLPTDFYSINPESCGVFSVDTEESPISQFAYTGYNSKKVGFYIKAGKIHLTGNINGKIMLRYIPAKTIITSEDDLLIGDLEFTEFYEQSLNELYSIYEEEAENEIISKKRAQKSLKEVLYKYQENSTPIKMRNADVY
jgi:hypothetical protein